MCLLAYADSEGPDQPVHQHRLIRTFSVCKKKKKSLDIIECFTGEQKPRWDFAHVQDDVNLHILHMLKDTFLHDMAHIH